MLSTVKRWLGLTPLSDADFARQRRELLTKTPVPVLWLLGKTGSGKSSIIRYLTGATSVEIGNGFRPQTRASRQYDFPTAEQPLVRFLDTRGLGEARYDAAEDLKAFGASAHLVIVTARITDQALEPVLEPLRKIRTAQPHRPVLLALTCLHEAYPLLPHPDGLGSRIEGLGTEKTADTQSDVGLPEGLRRCLLAQRERFAGLVDRIVLLDLTQPEEGFTPVDLGGNQLEDAVIALLPAAYRQTLLHLPDLRQQLQDLTEHQALPLILSYSSLAATAAAAPLPWVDIPVVMGLQGRLIYLLADLYGQSMKRDLLLQMAGAIGGRILTRFAIKAPLKLIPFLGLTANAALAFAYTFSLGKACCWYFGEVKAGHLPTQDDLSHVWNQQLKEAVTLWKGRKPATDSVNSISGNQ